MNCMHVKFDDYLPMISNKASTIKTGASNEKENSIDILELLNQSIHLTILDVLNILG